MNFVSSTLPSTIRAPQLGSRSYHLRFLTPGCPPPPALRLLLTGVEGSHPCAVFALAAAPRAPEAVKARHVLGAASRRRMARQSTSHRPPAPFERPSDAVAP
jgi:hypothetical protein